MHGHIICKDGKAKSAEFATITRGLQELTSLVLSDLIATDESFEVRRQIETSNLVRASASLDDYMEWLMEEVDDESEDSDDSASTSMGVQQKPARKGRTIN